MNRKLTKKQAKHNRELGKALARWKRVFPRHCRKHKLTRAQAKSVDEAVQKLLRDDAELEDFHKRNFELKLLKKKAALRFSRMLAKHVAALVPEQNEERARIVTSRTRPWDNEFFVTLGKCINGKCLAELLTHNVKTAETAIVYWQPFLKPADILERVEEAGLTVKSKQQIRDILYDLRHTKK